MEKKRPKTKEEARQYAIKWQEWQSNQSLSYGELGYWQNEFERIGEKFDLMEEFRENGIC
jgi:hypothetical protein